jgi:hypothetical protein
MYKASNGFGLVGALNTMREFILRKVVTSLASSNYAHGGDLAGGMLDGGDR